MNTWEKYFAEDWQTYGIAIGLGIGGLLVARLVSNLAGRVITRRVDAKRGSLVRAMVFYLSLAVLSIIGLSALDVPIATLLAAGGLLGIALGFVSQTALSNLISGIFLTFEQPFSVGDEVQIEGTAGTVEAVGVISTRVRTYDNVFVRLPNETVLKSKVTTLTKYGLRRVELGVSISYSDDIGTAMETLLQSAGEHPKVMRRPEPKVIVLSLADSGVLLQLRVWLPSEQWFDAASELRRLMKENLESAGCTIPFPQIVVHTGELDRRRESPRVPWEPPAGKHEGSALRRQSRSSSEVMT